MAHFLPVVLPLHIIFAVLCFNLIGSCSVFVSFCFECDNLDEEYASTKCKISVRVRKATVLDVCKEVNVLYALLVIC